MRKTLIGLGVAIALVGAACGGDTISENVVENLLEDELGGDVDVNIGGDDDNPEINIETEDGSISIGGGQVPDALKVPVPSGGDVQSSITSGDEIIVSLLWPLTEYDTLVSFYDDWTAQQPTDYEKTESTFQSADDVTIRTTNWYSSETDTTIGLVNCPTADGDRGVCLNILQSG